MQTVAVTGASGYIASCLVKELLLNKVNVNGTVRSLQDKTKVKHLQESLHVENGGKLTLFEADLLLDGSFHDCFQGVTCVFHTASPFQLNVQDAQRDLVDPAVKGTENVI